MDLIRGKLDMNGGKVAFDTQKNQSNERVGIMVNHNVAKQEVLNVDSDNRTLHWVNYMRAICIIGVYFIHSTSYYGYYMPELSQYIHPFYVNGFFVISGYLLFRKQLDRHYIDNGIREFTQTQGKRILENIFYKLVIPSIIFSVIEFFPNCLIQGRKIDIVYFIVKTIGGGTYWFTSAFPSSDEVL